MGPDVLLGLAFGLLLASVMLNIFLYLHRQSLAAVWKQRAIQAEDAKHAAELRSAEQIDAMLARVASREITLRPPSPPKVDIEARRYIPDTIDGDAAWNEYRGEPDDEPEDIPEELH